VEGEAAIVTQDADLLDLAGSAAIPDVEILDPLGFLRQVRAFYE
jgi:predicted nucleic acid-binding protein